jgi:hypothetical protein
MALFDFLNSNLRIHAQTNNSIKEFVILYPKKKGVSINISKDIIKNVLRTSDIVVNINTSLSYTGDTNIEECSMKLKEALKDLGLQYNFRIFTMDSQGSSLGQLLKLSKKKKDYEIITFMLPQNFNDYALFDYMIQLGCEILVPVQIASEITEQVFNGHFSRDQEKFTSFKYTLYISNFIDQTLLRTKVLDMGDVEKICNFQ